METTRSHRLILASNSPRRRELLSTLNLDFEVIPSDSDETVSSYASPAEFVSILAARKAHSVLKQANNSDPSVCVIGADTIVVIDGDILGKPTDQAHAIDMLTRLTGNTHTVYTGLCVCTGGGLNQVGCASTAVTMRPLSRSDIERYVDTDEPMDKAGAYAIQGYGSTLVTSIHGDYFTVVGLPLFLLYDYLTQAGVSVY